MQALRRFLTPAAHPNVISSSRRLPRIVWDGPAPTIYAVGDVHGCFAELIEVERKIVADGGGRAGVKLIVMLGDYVDRGPRSREVLDHLIRPPPSDFSRLCVRGNHDDAMLRFFREPHRRHDWLRLGGAATLQSYGPDAMRAATARSIVKRASLLREAVPPAHIAFLDALPTAVVVRDLVFVHAGLAPGAPLEAQSDHDLMWIREPFLTRGPEQPVLVIHGHTPTETPSVGPGRIGIDLGAYATGRLAALRIDERGLDLL